MKVFTPVSFQVPSELLNDDVRVWPLLPVIQPYEHSSGIPLPPPAPPPPADD